MTRFEPKAILIAMLLSLALDVVGGFMLLTLFGVQFASSMSPEQVDAAIKAVTQDQGYLLASLVYGTGTTLFGGYVAARIARRYPYFNALAVGVLAIVLSLLLANDLPWWFNAIGYLLTLPAAVLGGHLARQQRPA